MTQARPAVWLRNLALLYHVSVASAVERCTDSDPVMAGSFDGHTFLPTKGCYLGVPDVPDIFALLAGRLALGNTSDSVSLGSCSTSTCVLGS